MMINRSFILLTLMLSYLATACSGCVAPTVVPETSSKNIKAIKSVEVHAFNRNALMTGVHVGKGDLYTLIVDGRVIRNRWYEPARPEELLEVRIGDNIQVAPPINTTLASPMEGQINLIVKDKERIWHDVGTPFWKNQEWHFTRSDGSFKATIIVWNTRDIDQILSFFHELDSQNPNSEVGEKLITQAKSLKASFAEGKMVSAHTAAKKMHSSETVTAKSPQPETQSPISQPEGITASTPTAQAEVSAALDEPTQQSEVSEDQHSPLMLLLSPREGQKTSMETIQLIGVIEDDTALLKVEITVNGTPIILKMERGITIDSSELPARIEFNEQIPIAVGQNQLHIRAEDTSGRISEKLVSIERVASRGTAWAVVVGVNDYPNLPRLKYAVNDAQAFHDFLIDSALVKPDNVFRVVDDQATLNSLRTVLGTKLKKRARKGDKVIIYFAGHGATESDVNSPDGDGLEKYLLPYDADPENLYATALPMREIAHILNRIQSDSLIFIADSCYSGASGGRTVSIGGIRSTLSDNYIDRISGGKGRVILTASAANEISMEDESLGHGIFTYYLIKGLKGMADYDSDGYITVDEAYRYVSEQVPEATGQAQHPIKKGSVEGQLVLGVVR